MAAEPPEPASSRDAPPTAPSSSSSAAVVAGVGGPNPCCAKLWKKYQKLETSRTALREAVKLLQAENEKLQKENSELGKVCKEERLRGDSAEAARATESDARDLLEKEIIELKTQNSHLQQTQNICKHDNELLRISELEEENRKLKHILGEEWKKIASEKKKAEEEKSKALEMQKILKSETQKSEEYRRVADTERKVANDWRASCERLRSEANEVRAQLASQIQKTEEALKRAEMEKQKVAREKKRSDSEKSLAEKNKTLIEVERKKVSEEKFRADNLFAKLEEQKKLNERLRTSIQVETKNGIEEKKRADHLLQKLEEERKQNEHLQRKTNELCAGRDVISSGKYGRKHVDRASESANVKLLKEKLKLKKEQLKHVKNVSKLDKAKNALIRRELQRLKQDWMQLLSRFNMLDDHLAGGVEGIHVLTELEQHPEIRGFEQKLLPNDSVPAPYFGLQSGMVPFGSSIPRGYTSYQLPRESCTRPISGTSSELGPPLGSSHRTKSKKSKSHYRSSCPTSTSDEKFMGSQGKDGLFVSSSTDIRNNQASVVPERCPKDSNGRSLPLEASKLPLSGCTEVTDKTLGGDRRRKRTKKSVEPAACLPYKHGLLHSELKAHAATSNDDPSNNNMLSVTEGDMESHRRKYLAVSDKAPSFSFPSKVPSPGAGNDCAGSKFASLLSFEEMIKENCLKLLNFDDDADEEKYRKAKERPLSPNLPIIRPRRTKVPTCAEPGSLGDRTVNCCPASGSDSIDSTMSEVLEVKEPGIQKLAQNCIQLDPSSNRIECSDYVEQLGANNKSKAAGNVSCSAGLAGMPTNASFGSLLHEDVAGNSDTGRLVLSGSSCVGHSNSILHFQHLSKEVPSKNSSHKICDRSSNSLLQSNVGASETTVTKPNNLDSISMLGHYCGSERPPMHLVVSTRMKRSTMINILRYWEMLDSQSRDLSKESSIDGPLLEKVSTDPLISTDEKVSLIFSLLLWDLRFAEETFADGNFASSAFSLSVKSHMETRWTILRGDQLDVLISLIEDFLLNKEVIVCEKMGQKAFGASKDHELDDEAGIQISVKPAKVDQFIAACILLASICVEVERVDVVLEVSYKVLQMGKSNLLWTLLALHVFGSMCGDKFLFPKSCNFLTTAIRLVVQLLESKDPSLCLMSSYVQSDKPTTLPSCAHCLFDVDKVSIDGFISSLLDELDLCSLLWNNHAYSNETTRHSSHSGSSGLEINCGELCCISKQGKLAEDSGNCPAGISLCYFTELISLLELFGIYMSCEWTYSNVIVRLLEILESCMCDEYSAALLVLVSQLGRSFIDNVGYEQRRVSELRDKLSSLLAGTSFTKSRSLSVQFSAIGALLSVLPLPFDKIIATQSRQLSGPFVVQERQISEWFVQLSNEHQSLARSFFS
ncbi:hypothetical protein SETIT_5G332000v2 [Setaria italica]|uniref:Maternal effect embryo arrest 22 n=2 Tax=Setaria italica TaxID=4555 RepID=A0A368RD59_SETIT|nr:uncharacterized protein LOC101760716 [Setaria italica]RCV27530.1 hypothetical protein SETIT_5G332000v2 [Setaria italica]